MIRGKCDLISSPSSSYVSQEDIEKNPRKLTTSATAIALVADVGDNDTSFEIDEPEDEEVDQDIEHEEEAEDGDNHGQGFHDTSSSSHSHSHSAISDDDDEAEISDNKEDGLSTPTNEVISSSNSKSSKYKIPNYRKRGVHGGSGGNSVRKKCLQTTTAYIENERQHGDGSNASCNNVAPQVSSTITTFCHSASIHEDGSNEDLSDNSCDSYTFSSTPTTADVADVSAAAALNRFSQGSGGSRASANSSSHKLQHPNSLQQQQHLHHQQQQHLPAYLGGHVAADDNISGSLATTTTEIDLDNTTNITSISPNVGRRATGGGGIVSTHKHSNSISSTTPASHQHPANHRRVNSTVLNIPTMLLTHPSAALQENISIKGSTSLDLPTTSGGRRHHQRSLSAASHRSVISQHSAHTANTTLSIVEPKSRIWSSLSWICVRFQVNMSLLLCVNLGIGQFYSLSY